jgi:hypothetical protein
VFLDAPSGHGEAANRTGLLECGRLDNAGEAELEGFSVHIYCNSQLYLFDFFDFPISGSYLDHM